MALQVSIYIHICEWDWLLVKAEVFPERLRESGEILQGEVVTGVPHA